MVEEYLRVVICGNSYAREYIIPHLYVLQIFLRLELTIVER